MGVEFGDAIQNTFTRDWGVGRRESAPPTIPSVAEEEHNVPGEPPTLQGEIGGGANGINHTHVSISEHTSKSVIAMRHAISHRFLPDHTVPCVSCSDRCSLLFRPLNYSTSTSSIAAQ
jgi:hypothetical protein